MTDLTLQGVLNYIKSNYGNNAKFVSKLSLDGNLYDIHDVSVDQLAAKVVDVANALNSEISSITSNMNGVTDTAVTNQYVTSIYLDSSDGKIKANRAQIDASEITTDTANTSVQDALTALANADAALLGTVNDTGSSNTIYGAKAYAKALVDALLGEDSATSTLETLKQVITELKNAEAAGGITGTVLDTFTNMLGGLGTTPAEGTEGEAGYVPAHATTVKEYVDSKFATASSNLTAAIAALDATVGSTTVATGKHVAVQVVETDGVLTSLTVTEDDIASATALSQLESDIEEQNEVVAALTDLDARVTAAKTVVAAGSSNVVSVSKSTAANGVDTYTVNVAVTYNSGTETLTIGSAAS